MLKENQIDQLHHPKETQPYFNAYLLLVPFHLLLWKGLFGCSHEIHNKSNRLVDMIEKKYNASNTSSSKRVPWCYGIFHLHCFCWIIWVICVEISYRDASKVVCIVYIESLRRCYCYCYFMSSPFWFGFQWRFVDAV